MFIPLVNWSWLIIYFFVLVLLGLQQQLWRDFGIRPSISIIKSARWKLGWRKTGPKYCQCVREPNRVARLAFAERCLEAEETFDDVVFTDESSIWLERHNKVCFRKKGMPAKLKPTVKHPYKVHVWGGISKRGATSILIFTGIKEFYVEAILRDTLLPFVRERFPDGYRFQQDNDPKHKSKRNWNCFGHLKGHVKRILMKVCSYQTFSVS